MDEDNLIIKSSEAHLNEKTRKSRKFKYCLNKDLQDGGGAKTSAFFNNDLDIIVKYICDITPPDNNYYEVVKSIMRRLYFDFDFEEVETEGKYSWFKKTNGNINAFISRHTTHIFKEIGLRDDSIDTANIDYIIQYSEIYKNGVCYINGLHIILSNIVMNFENMKAFITYLNHTYNFKLDDRVYSSVQNFRLLHNTKKGQDRPLKSFGIDRTPEDYLISNIYGDNNIFIYEEDSEVITQLNNSTEDGEPVEEKTKIAYSDFKLVFEQIIKRDLLSPLFWISKKWGLTTKMIKGLDIYDLDKWAKLSSEKATQFNYKDNMTYINNIDTSEFVGGFKTITTLINGFMDKHILAYDATLGIIDTAFKEFVISNFGDLPITDITDDYIKQMEAIDPIDRHLKVLNSNQLTLSLSSGLCCYNGGKPINYYTTLIDKSIKASSRYNEVAFDYSIDDINDPIIMSHIEDAIYSSSNYTIGLRAYMGTGKTNAVERKIMTLPNRANIPRYALSPNNSFNAEITEKLNGFEDNRPFKSHLDIRALSKNKKGGKARDFNIISSLESIDTIFNNAPFIEELYLDELETILSHFDSSTIKDGDRYRIFTQFKAIVLKAKKVILLDAFLSYERVKLITDIRGETSKTLMINVNNNNYQQTDHIVYNDAKFFKKKMLDTAEDKRVIIYSNSKGKTEAYKKAMKEAGSIKNKVVIILNAYGVIISRINKTKTNTEEIIGEYKTIPERRRFYTALEYNITEKYKADILIYSPTLSIGNSLNKTYFYTSFGYFNNKSITASSVLQMIYRIRRTERNEINLYFENNIKPFKKREDINYYIKFLQNSYIGLTNDCVIQDNQRLNRIDDKLYMIMRGINSRETEESKQNILGVLYRFLSINHKINIIWNNEKEKNKVMDLSVDKEALFNKFNYTKIGKCDNTYYPADIIKRFEEMKQDREQYLEGVDEGDLEFKDEDAYNKFNSMVLASRDETAEDGEIRNNVISWGILPIEQILKVFGGIDKPIPFDWWETYIYDKTNISIIRAIRNLYKYSFKLGCGQGTIIELDEPIKKGNINKSGIDATSSKHIKQLKNNTIHKVLEKLNIDQTYIRFMTRAEFDELLTDAELLDQLEYYINAVKVIKPNKKNKDYYYNIIKDILKIIGMNMKYNDHHQKNIIIEPTELFNFNSNYNEDVDYFNRLVGGVELGKDNTTFGDMEILEKAKDDVLTYKSYYTEYNIVDRKRITEDKIYTRTIKYSELKRLPYTRLYIKNLQTNQDEGDDNIHYNYISRCEDGIYRFVDKDDTEDNKEPFKETESVISLECDGEIIKVFIDTYNANCFTPNKNISRYSKQDKIDIVKSSYYRYCNNAPMSRWLLLDFTLRQGELYKRPSYDMGIIEDLKEHNWDDDDDDIEDY